MRMVVVLLSIIAFVVSCSSSGKKESTKEAAAAQAIPSPAPNTSATSTAPSASTAVDGGVTCKNGSDERVLKVEKQGSGCDVQYTKFKETNSVASSANGTAHCEATVSKVRSNLEGAGFKCE